MSTLIVGNGQSRLKIKKLPQHKDLIVCNAAYRNFNSKNVVAVDKRMLSEVLTNSSATVWTRPDSVQEYFNNHRVKVLPCLPVVKTDRQFKSYNWGSGTSALILGARIFGDLEIIGFDFYSRNQFVNNVYKGTANYSDASAPAVDPAFWINQTELIMDCFPEINFTFYVDPDLEFPQTLLAKKNLTLKNI